MSVYAGVRDALDGLEDDWRKRLALTLALALDDAPKASDAKELRSLMAELTGDEGTQEVDAEDELRARRAARIAAAKSGKRPAADDVGGA